ncbi:MAG: hypothetical protein OQJ87_09235, partial [Rhodospirillales bacterium]|nr:hypothetical protein [Rhodospirillales bacterium]
MKETLLILLLQTFHHIVDNCPLAWLDQLDRFGVLRHLKRPRHPVDAQDYMAFFNDIAMAARIAARDVRGGAKRLWLLVGGVLVGAAAVALVGTASQSLIDGARQGALETVGGDLSLRLFHRPPNEAELAAIGREGDITISTELRPMARAIRDDQSEGAPLLVEFKGVDQRYPIYGEVATQPAGDLHQMINRQNDVYGAVADPALFEALGLKPGDSLQIGNVRYQLRGVLLAEPDRAFRAFTLGPRIMVSNESLPATGVTDDGAAVYYYTRVKLPAGSDAAAALARIDRAFPQSGWRMVNAHDGVPGVERALSMAHVLLLFIGLGVMLVGGAGISGAVRAHVAEKMVIIAILKSIGARPIVVTMAIGFEVMAAAALGALAGIVLGALGPVLAAAALADQLPFALATTPGVKPLAAAGLFGLLVAALFAWWPLMGVHNMNAQLLLRERLVHPPGKPDMRVWLGAGVIVAALVALIFQISPMPTLTVAFLIGALILAAFYYALGVGLSRFAKVLSKGKSANLRHALGNLYRAGAPTGPVVMALGLALTLLVALDGIGGAASRHMENTLPRSAPDLVAFSVAPDVASKLDVELANTGIVEHQRIMPFLHARVQAIGGEPVRELDIPGSLNWVVRGDRGVSFAAKLPDGAKWADGQADIPGYSVDEGVARKLGIGPGDTITLNISGQ